MKNTVATSAFSVRYSRAGGNPDLGISGIFQGCCDLKFLDSRLRGNDGGGFDKICSARFQTTFATSFLHFFQFRKLGVQLFHALFAEVDGQSGGFAFVHGIDDDAGAEFGVADVLPDAEACVGLGLFVVVDDFVFWGGGLARAAVAVVGCLFDG